MCAKRGQRVKFTATLHWVTSILLVPFNATLGKEKDSINTPFWFNMALFSFRHNTIILFRSNYAHRHAAKEKKYFTQWLRHCYVTLYVVGHWLKFHIHLVREIMFPRMRYITGANLVEKKLIRFTWFSHFSLHAAFNLRTSNRGRRCLVSIFLDRRLCAIQVSHGSGPKFTSKWHTRATFATIIFQYKT